MDTMPLQVCVRSLEWRYKMADINVCTFVGRLTKDAELKVFPNSGKKFLNFSIANNTGYGEYAKVQFFDCMMIGDKRAEGLKPYLGKGQMVCVTGEQESNDYTKADGTQHRGYKLQVKELQLIGGKPGANKDGHQELEDDEEEQDAVPYNPSEDAAELDKRLKEQTSRRYRGAKVPKNGF